MKLSLRSKSPTETQIHSCLQAGKHIMWPGNHDTPLCKKKKNPVSAVWFVPCSATSFWADLEENNIGFINKKKTWRWWKTSIQWSISLKSLSRKVSHYQSKKRAYWNLDWSKKIGEKKKGLALLLNAVPFYSNHLSAAQRNRHRSCNQYVTWTLLLIQLVLGD